MSIENPTEQEAPLVHLANIELDGLSEDELRQTLQKIREVRKVPQKRAAATSTKKSKIMSEIEHLL